MYCISRQTHPATGIEHSLSCYFFNNDEVNLVTAGANIVKVFRLFAESDSKETNALGQPIPPKMKLECLATYQLFGCVMSMASVRCPSMGRDLLLLSFKEAKMSVVQYDPATNNLVTLSMHYFEEEDMKGGWTSHVHIPWIRVDPEGRCAALLLYGKKLAILPFRKDTVSEETDVLETKPGEDMKKNVQQEETIRTPTLASYVIVLKDLDDKIDNVLDMQFLYGYYEPTLLILYEPVRTFPGRTAVRSDTCATCGVSLNVAARVHPVIWAVGGLPFDAVQTLAVQKPLGGCLIFCVNSLIYLNQSVPPYGVSLNSIANNTTNFPLRLQEGVCLTLGAARAAALADNRYAVSLGGGQLYVLTLLADSVRTVRAFHLDRAASSVLAHTMCVIQEDFLFLGSRLGNSLLLRVTERENRLLHTLDRPLEATVDLTEDDAEDRWRAPADSAAADATDQDQLEVYGTDVRTATQLGTQVFEVSDSLLNIAPVGDAALGPRLEWLCCSGAGKNGALSVLRRDVPSVPVTAFHLPGCVDLWTVFAPPDPARKEPETDAKHAYIILSHADCSMILQTGEEINEVENSGFASAAPTVLAANLGGNKYMVQVTTDHIRLLNNGTLIQNIALEWQARGASVADPYLCVESACGRALVLALRETAGRDGAMSGRLAPTRQPVPHSAPLLCTSVYRDLSGLFTAAGAPAAQVKGEFTGKSKSKPKDVKAEGFEPGAVYEVDDDAQLYAGDQTPASIHTIMLEEQSRIQSAPARCSYYWRRHLQTPKPTYWLLAARDSGNLEIYSLPEMRLSYLVRDFAEGERILSDSLEAVPAAAAGAAAGEAAAAARCRELLCVGLGRRAARPLLLLRTESEIVVYQAYRYPRGYLKLRFSRVCVPLPRPAPAPADPAFDTVKQMRYFGNVAGYSGVHLAGPVAHMLLMTSRGDLRCHPHAHPAVAFAPFHHDNCPRGLLHTTDKDELRITALSTHMSFDAPWPLRKVPLRASPRFVAYHAESRAFCLAQATARPTQTYYRFNGEDKQRHTENKGARFPYPQLETHSICLFSGASWQAVPGSRVELHEWERVTCLANVSLAYEGTRSGLRGYIAIGTNYNYSEDITSRGRIIIYDIIDVVPEPGQPLTAHKLKEIHAREQKGPVSALAQVLGLLVAAIGQKIYLWQLKDNDLVGVAFIDTQIYVHRVIAANTLILAADVYKSISLLRYQPTHRTLSLVSRDLRNVQIYDTEFMVDNSSLGFLVSESEGNLALFMYQPQARESYGGQRLIKKADFHLGQQVHKMFRVNANAAPAAAHRRHVTMYTTLDGALGYVLPIAERQYRRLLMLQSVLNSHLCHLAGLNPRGFRTYKCARRTVGGGAARGVLDGDLVSQYVTLPNVEKAEIARKIGTKVEEIISDLYEIDKATAHYCLTY